MAGVTIRYKGATIAAMEGQSVTKTLQTKGAYCEDDITVQYVPESGAVPSGVIHIAANGTYDVTDKASAVVAVPVHSKSFSVTLSETQTGEVAMNPNGDSEIAAHYTDSTFIVGVIRKTETNVGGYLCGIASNNNLRTDVVAYGTFSRATGSGISWGNVAKTVASGSNRVAGTVTVSASGVISVYGSTSVPLNAGEYLVMCSW